MMVFVKINFFEEPPQEELYGMIKAAMSLTKDQKTVYVDQDNEAKNALIAIFKMKNEAQYKAIEKVWPRFASCTPSRTDMSVRFEKEGLYKNCPGLQVNDGI